MPAALQAGGRERICDCESRGRMLPPMMTEKREGERKASKKSMKTGRQARKKE